MNVHHPARPPRIAASRSPRGGAAILAVSVVLGVGAVPGTAAAQEAAHAPGAEAARGETAVIRGEVHGTMAGRRLPLAHAWVSLDRGGDGGGAAVTDSEGRYEIPGVPPGVRRIRVERIGYRPHHVEVVVPPGARLVVDLELEGDPVLVKGLTVRASRIRPVETSDRASETELVDVALRTLELAPGGPESGLAAARALAGGEPGGDATLLVRGGDPDPKQVLLDGIPIHTPFHLGGLVEAVDTSLLGGVSDYAGAAPAPVLGGLSRVTSLTTRAPSSERLAGQVALDAVSAGGRVEGPLGGGVSALLSGRGLHGAGPRILDGSSLPYGYGEAILRIDAAPGDDHHLAMTGFWNRESTRLDFPSLTPSGRTLDTEGAGEEAHWGNGAVSLRYEGGSGPFDLGAAVAASRYDAALPLGRERPAWARGRTDRLRAGVDAGRSAGPWSVGFGIAAEEIRHTSSARLLVDDERRSVDQTSEGTVVGAHLDARRALAPDVTVRLGLRADHFSPAEGFHLSPRASLAWLLSETAVLHLAAGRHFHFVQPAELEAQVVLDDPGATRAGQALFPVAGASHLVLGLDQALTSAVSLGMEGYVKAFEGLPDAQGDRLRASGVDLRIRRVGESSRAWMGYSLAWFWDPDPAQQGSPDGARPFRGRHLLTTGLDGRITDLLAGSVRVSYGDGLPLSSVPVFGADATATPDGAIDVETPPEEPLRGDAVAPTLDGFLRVDLEISAAVDGSLGGREARFRPYLRLVNALDRRDALFFYFEPWRSPGARAVAERSVLPVLGLEVTF